MNNLADLGPKAKHGGRELFAIEERVYIAGGNKIKKSCFELVPMVDDRVSGNIFNRQ